MCETRCFHALPKSFEIEDNQIILFLHALESLHSPIFGANFGVLMPSQRHFNQKIFKYVIPARPRKSRFSNFMCKTRCFHAFPKAFQIEDIQVHYSCQLLKAQSLQFYVQASSNSVSWCLPKGFSNRRYSNNIVPAHPGKPRLFNFWCKTFFFKCLPNGISNRRYSNTFFSPPLQGQIQILSIYVQNSVFWGLPKSILNRRFSNILFLPTPESVDSTILFEKIRCFDAFPHVFQIEDIQIHDSCPLLQVQIRQFYVQNSVCWCLPKSISNRRYSNIIVPAHPWKPRFSNVLCKTRCFDAFPKTLQITYIQIYYSCPPLTAQILQFFRSKPAVLRFFQRCFE